MLTKRFVFTEILNKFCQPEGIHSIEESDPDSNDDALITSALGTSPSTISASAMTNQRRSFSLDHDTVFNKYDSNSNDDSQDETIPKGSRQQQERIPKKKSIGYAKSHLRIIYDWLRGLYVTQMTRTRIPDLYTITRSTSVYSKTTAFQRLPSSGGSVTQAGVSTSSGSSLLSPMDMQSQNMLQQSPNMTGLNSGPQSSSSSFILRKKFNYKTKYNLTGMQRFC